MDHVSMSMKNKTLEIREYHSKDLEKIAQIYNEHILAANCTMDEQIKTYEDIKNWVKDFNKRETILILKKADGIIGWGMIKRYSDKSGYRTTCETAIYIKSSEIGKGYGLLLKKVLIDKCKEFGYHHLVAKIFANNKRSIKYNKKLGYEIVGRQKEVGKIKGRWVDTVIMQLII